MDELVREVRRTNSLLRLAFGQMIRDRVNVYLGRTGPRLLMSLLAESNEEVPVRALQERATERGISRATMYRALEELAGAGLVEKPRRGFVSLSEFAVPYVPFGDRTSDEFASGTAKRASQDKTGGHSGSKGAE